MWLKFFRASGHDELLELENEVNVWLEDKNPKIEKVETNLCPIKESPEGEMYQYALVSIWYKE